MGTTKIAAGFAVGYILGARAGRDTYQRIVNTTRTLANQPAAQRAQATINEAATTAADSAAAKPDDVTRADAETVAGKPRTGRGNHDTTSEDTAIPPAASDNTPTHSGPPAADRSTRSI